MPLELRSGSKYWYGRYKINNRRICISLKVPVAGKPPPSLTLLGDTAFEVSREKAKNALERFIEEAHEHRDTTRLVERMYLLKTGEKIKSVSLDDLAIQWLAIPRRRPLNPRYVEHCNAILKRFVTFVREKYDNIEELAQVTRAVIKEFMDAEEARGITEKTWNDSLKLIRAACKYLLPPGTINPCFGIPTREEHTIFRVPYTAEELKLIVDAAQHDDFIRPIIITGICSAMRRGDCCKLRWKDVDMAHRFINVKTAKTGQTVTIPIFPMLYDELLKHQKGTGGFVFPEQAAMYEQNPDCITTRVQDVLVSAFCNVADDKRLPQLPEAEVRRKARAYIASIGHSGKISRMTKVFDAYMDGESNDSIQKEMGISKGSLSNYLNEIQEKIGCRIIRGRHPGPNKKARKLAAQGILNVERENGKRRASIRDFHSFRVTWVTLALTAGVPLELVQKVTGHKTTEIVMKHYFQPGREAFRTTLQAAMPRLLTNGQKTPKEQALEILAESKSGTWKKDAARIREILAAL
jgi:integrase